MSFKKFTKPGRCYVPKVSIRKSGQIGLTSALVREWNLNKFKFVVLYYDSQKQIIGIQPVQKHEEGVIRMRFNSGMVDISAKSFLDHFGIPYKELQRYTPEWDEDQKMILVRLNDE